MPASNSDAAEGTLPPASPAATRWSGRDYGALVNQRIRNLSAGSSTDWGMPGAPSEPRVPPISLGGGIPDGATQPRADLLEAMRRALATEDDAPFVYGGAQGYEPLRREIGQYFARDHAEPPTAEHFALTNGAAGAIDLVCAALLDPGDVVITEAPTFTGTIRTMRGHGAEIVDAPMDAEGLRADAVADLVDELQRDGRSVKLIYTTPTFHNPTGVTMSVARRAALVEAASDRGVLILEDSAYADLYFSPQPVPSLSAVGGGYGVITAGTFSKVIATGLRVGWVQAQPALIEQLVPARFDMGNSPLLHRMLHEYMVRGGFHEHVQRMRTLYASKLDVLASALREGGEPYFDFTQPEGGFFLWLRLRDGLDADAVQAAAVKEGVTFPIGRAFYPTRDYGADGQSIRLAYSWAPQDHLREAAARLLRACARAGGR